MADAGDAAWDCDTRQAQRVLACAVADTGDGSGDLVGGSGIPSGICLERREVLVEQHAATVRVVRVAAINVDSRQIRRVMEGAVADIGDATGDGDTCQARRAVECAVADAGDATWDCDAHQTRRALERVVADIGDATWDGDTRQTRRALERAFTDGGDATWDRDTRQARRARERAKSDTGDGSGDLVSGLGISGWVCHQRCEVLVEEHTATVRVIHVGAVDVDIRQARRVLERVVADTGDATRDRDTRQTRRVLESSVTEAGDAARDCDTRQTRRALERVVADTGDATWNCDTRQA